VPPNKVGRQYNEVQGTGKMCSFIRGLLYRDPSLYRDSTVQRDFCTGYDYEENADLSKDYWNPKRKLWVTKHF